VGYCCWHKQGEKRQALIVFFIISLLSSFGLAVAVVEKGKEWPLRKPLFFIRRWIYRYISKQFEQVFDCTVCMSFWTALIVDSILYFIFGYFLWPLSGFVALGFTWFAIQILNAIDPKE
jgi:hypothetical protein